MNINKKLLFTTCTYAMVFIMGYCVKYGIDFINARQAKSNWKICNDLGKTYSNLRLKKSAEYGFVPKESVIELESAVPTAEAAAYIANTILSSNFNSKFAKRQIPYNVKLINDVIWIVEGSQSVLTEGGVSYIWIQNTGGNGS